MFTNTLFKVKSCEIGLCTISDHNLVNGDFCLNSKNRSTFWWLNTNILNYPDTKESLKKEIEIYLDHNENEDVSPGI